MQQTNSSFQPGQGRYPLAVRIGVIAALFVIAGTAIAYFIGRAHVDEPQRPAFAYVMAGLALAGLLGAAVIAAIVERSIRACAQQIVALSRDLGDGRRVAETSISHGSFHAANQALSEAASRVQQKIHTLETELHGLNAILFAMEEGLLVIDEEKRVLMANAAARKILNLSEEDLAGRPLKTIIRQSELISNLDLALSDHQTCSFEFQVLPQKRFVLARCSPYQNDTASRPGSPRQHGAVAVLHDITELRRLEKVRTEFVANVSHELRTPLTSLMGYLETLSDDTSDPEQVQKFLAVCRRQAERLSRIVEDLLRLSRLENPQQEIAVSEIDLSQVVNTAVDQCQTQADDRKITVETYLPDRAATIFGDRGLLTQALSNLIENAINYNREGGRVKVRLRPFSDGVTKQWEISVEDTGIGIPFEAVGRIFERFYRVDKARSREGGGTGLGLSIVRHIALAHGASVHVESELEKGSTFSLRFKVREPREQPVAHEIV